MALDSVHDFFGKRIDLARFAKGTVAQMATCTPGDLAEFGRRQLPELMAVELAVLGEGDMIDVQIEAHADRIRGNQKVDIAGLVELDLCVAGAGGQCAEHDRNAAALSAYQFADRVDLIGRECHDGGAARQPRNLLLPGMGQVRHARSRDDGEAAQQPFEDTPHRAGAQQERFLASAQMQDTIGEDVAAFHVGGKLNLVDGDESRIRLPGHRLDRANRKARAGRRDLFLAGNQRHIGCANLLGHAAIDLACQQAQRQTDQARFMRHHALDGEMRLAGIGRSEHGGYVAAG